MANRLRIQAPAKLNLFLHINARGSDGYHHIQTLFQPIGWYDRITLTLQSDMSISVFMSAHGVVLPTLPEQERIKEERARTVAYLFGALLLLLVTIM